MLKLAACDNKRFSGNESAFEIKQIKLVDTADSFQNFSPKTCKNDQGAFPLFRIILNRKPRFSMKLLRFFTLILLTTLMRPGYSTPPEKVGVLVLAHGGSDSWNQLVVNATQSVGETFPVEVAFGMALPRTIQEGIDKLESKGVTKIVVVPLFISSHSFIIRQTEYLLKKRDVLADPPMVMDHSSGSSHGSHSSHNSSSMNHASGAGDKHGQDHGKAGNGQDHGQSSETLAQLNFKAEIIITKALDDHPLVAEILYSRIKELSTKPANETVIIVGHGPNPEEDNKNWVKAMESLAEQVRQMQKKEGTESRFIFSVTVRDDANKEVYELAKENLRGLVRQSGTQGDVIVVPLLLSKGGVEQGIVKRLEGLNYKWSGKVLLPDSKLEDFIEASVIDAIKKK
ncbi:MAG TPA: CbiX/SirB N-terminal domain-containing protein [Cyclobacteriaceae bacterium]|nr:CbiX/SirB N-terminal domain-containing protein [Cyclobacteriaceae bacterium]